MTRFFLSIICFFLICCFNSCKPHRERRVTSQTDSAPISENASKADSLESVYPDLEIPYMADSVPRQIIRREAYITCYNHDTRCPNWVAWALTREKAQGTTEKKIWYDDNGNAIGIADFNTDMVRRGYIFDAEADQPRPELDDWDVMPEGMSHGHMCPAMDSKMSPSAMTQSFLLTNLCVQAEKLNTGSWQKLERKCHDLAIKYGCLYIVTGPVFNNRHPSAFMGEIAIPDAFFKVVLCMVGTPKAIGFIYYNTNDPHNMQDAVRTVDQIEEITGFDFYPQLPDNIENEIESKANLNEWQ